jgi:predicted lipoprotein with Yx(FWY)xxD motif
MKRKITVLAAPVAIALITAGCGISASSPSSSSGPYGSAGPASPSNGIARTTKVGIANSALGRIVVDGKGSTLYLFENDKGRASTCFASCASAWPPVTFKGKLAAGRGVLAGALGTTDRQDGKVGVTYDGHPLYYFAGDVKPGDTNGEALNKFGADWYVLAPSGKKIDRD